ncbi:MAG: O-acetyl-ADP-ribose deacetylase [Spirochaetales bacterium]|nr:O-acetyl-ADP-ribose deacetylase [Spirochaetales bacterium]
METLGTYLNGRLIVALGDITTYEGDAIVNAANSELAGGGGVDGAIHRAAGPRLIEACRALRAGPLPNGLPAGGAAATIAGNLNVRAVIHAVGPIWRGGVNGEREKLASAYRRSLELARENSWLRVAFPAISTGVYGYPKEEAAKVAYATVAAFLNDSDVPLTLSFVFFSRSDALVFIKANAL